MILNSLKKKIVPASISGILICVFLLAPISHVFTIKKAEAAIDYDPYNTIVNTFSWISSKVSELANSATAVSTGSLFTKEYILDTIVWPLTNIVIKEMIRSTTQWVKSGFKGSPAFVTDLEGFLLDIADKVAGNYIYGSPLSALCSPFSLNIKLALDIQYRETSRGGYVAQCRLSSVIGNVDRFMQGDFMQGGWDGWYNVALTPANNPYGAMLEAQGGLYARISGAQGAQIKLLDFGNGFLSTEYCFSEGEDERCSIETPGVIVQDQVNRALGLPGDRLIVADEINELVGALFSQLAGQVLSGAGGLLGLNDSPRGGGPSYFDQVIAEGTPVSYVNTSGGPIESTIENETKYLNFQKTIVDIITDAEMYKDQVYGSTTCSITLTSSLENKLESAERSVVTASTTIALFTVLQEEYATLQDTESSASSVTTILDKYKASSIPDAQSKIMEQYLQYQASGILHSPGDLVNLELITIPEIQKEIPPFKESVDQACRRRGNRNNDDSGD